MIGFLKVLLPSQPESILSLFSFQSSQPPVDPTNRTLGNETGVEPLNCDRSKLQRLTACHQVKPIGVQDKSVPIQTFWGELLGGGGGISATETSEDCLYLNVWAPLRYDGTPYPPGTLGVLFFIHGGEFQYDSAFNNLYEGTSLAFKTMGIVVTFNYRLGPFGFLYDTEMQRAPEEVPGNVGLRDAAKALEWVHHNIEQFGGIQDYVTLYGAGAAVQYLMTSPLVPKSYYKRAILSSGVLGSQLSYQSPEIAKRNARQLSTEVEGPSWGDHVKFEALQRSSAESILTFARNLLNESSTMDGKSMFLPTTDSKFFPLNPKSALEKMAQESGPAKPVLIGFNQAEGSYTLAEYEMVPDGSYPMDALSDAQFTAGVQKIAPETHTPEVLAAVKEQYLMAEVGDLVIFITDYWYKCDILNTIDALEKSANRRVFKYRFDAFLDVARKAYPYFAAGHAMDRLMIWGRPSVNPSLSSTEERGLSHAMAQLGLNFASESWDQIESPKGSILSLQKHSYFGHVNNLKVVEIPDNKCHFIHCLPDLRDWYSLGSMTDESCRKYVEAEPQTGAAAAPSASITLTLIGVIFVTWMQHAEGE